jgi:O-antigen ligase
LWLLSLRFSNAATKNLALFFVSGVAVYAVFASSVGEQVNISRNGGAFGFFPNRNHTGNLLSMGLVCGLGVFFQGVRSKQFGRLVAALVLSGVIFWAILSWNISRSAIVLSVAGILMWAVFLGWRYFGRHELKVFSLFVILVAGVYSLSEFTVKDRLEETVEKISLGEEQSGSPGSGSELKEDRLDDFDFRVPIAKDTFRLLCDFPLTGVGAGQYRWVFPQYREETITANRAVALHPESSWLWLAAEWGIPAMAGLLALVIWLYFQGIKNIKKRGHRDRAIQMGCLVASAMVPLHSLFDVPGHRPALFIASLVLFVISQNESLEPDFDERVEKWYRRPGALTGVLLIFAGITLFGNSWFGLEKPTIVSSEEKLANAIELYEQIKEQESPMQPLKTMPLREELDEMLAEAIAGAPLDGRLYRLRGLALLPLTYRSDDVARDFAVDRALTPYSIQIPLIHASAALPYHENEVEKGWRAAVNRAVSVDQIGGDESNAADRAARAIRNVVRKVPRYQPLADQVLYQ